MIKDYMQSPDSNPFRIIVALTMGDWLQEVHYNKCKTIKDIYDTIFASMDSLLPGYEDKFLVTGWRADDPSDETRCAQLVEQTLASAIARILQEKPDEKQSPWLSKLHNHIGTAKLKRRYNKLMKQQGKVLLSNVVKWLEASLQTLDDELQKLYERKTAIEDSSLGHDLLEFCTEVEKMAASLRLSTLDRPSSSPADLDAIEDVTKRSRQTLAEELRFLQQTFGLRLTAAGGDLEEVGYLKTSFLSQNPFGNISR